MVFEGGSQACGACGLGDLQNLTGLWSLWIGKASVGRAGSRSQAVLLNSCRRLCSMKAVPRKMGTPEFLPPSGASQPLTLGTAELGGSFVLVPQGSRGGWQSHTAPRKVSIPFVCGCCYQKKKAWSIQQVFFPQLMLADASVPPLQKHISQRIVQIPRPCFGWSAPEE